MRGKPQSNWETEYSQCNEIEGVLYSRDETVNRTLQMQVRREVEKLKGNVSTSALAVLSAVNVMVALSSTTVTRLALISMEESNDGTSTLSFPSPLKKTQKTSHQHQIDCQNGRKGKDAMLWLCHGLQRSLPLRGSKRRRMPARQQQSSHRSRVVQSAWLCGEIG